MWILLIAAFITLGDTLLYLYGFDLGYLYLLKVFLFIIFPLVISIYYIYILYKKRKKYISIFVASLMIVVSQFLQLNYSDWKNRETEKHIEKLALNENVKSSFIWDFDKGDMSCYTNIKDSIGYIFINRPLGPKSIYDIKTKQWFYSE